MKPNRGSAVVVVAPHDRPREKLLQSGVSSLGDNELLALLIGHGTAGASALTVANGLLEAAGSRHGLTRMTVDEMASVPGLGGALASRVQAGVELGRRTLDPPARERAPVHGPRDAAALLLPRFGSHGREQTGVMLLDARHRLLRIQVISVGGLDAAVVEPRDVFRPAIGLGAAAVVVFHNHPSGDPTPSQDDVVLTRRLVAAGDMIGIALVDHLVLADGRYCSIRRSRGL